jgi:hypothetical protein
MVTSHAMSLQPPLARDDDGGACVRGVAIDVGWFAYGGFDLAAGLSHSSSSMHDEDVAMIRQTRALISDREAFAASFFAALRAHPCFGAVSGAPGAVAMAMVAALLDGERGAEELAAIGRRHAGYGACEADFDDVGIALLTSLRRVLGAAYTPEVEQAWAAAYGEMAEAMIAAAALPAQR